MEYFWAWHLVWRMPATKMAEPWHQIQKTLALRIRNFVCFAAVFFGLSLATLPTHPLPPPPRRSQKCNAWLLTQWLLLFLLLFLFLFSFGCAWPPFRHAFITQAEVSIGFQFCFFAIWAAAVLCLKFIALRFFFVFCVLVISLLH